MPPRRLPQIGAERQATVNDRMAGGSRQGSTRNARPVAPNPRSAGRATHPDTPYDRLIVNYFTNAPATDLTGSSYSITSWPDTFESVGGAVRLNPAGDDGGVYLFAEGVYAVNMILEVNDIGTSPADCGVCAWCQVWDVTADTGEPFAVSVRGGDAGVGSGTASPGTSRVFYSPGGGVPGGGISFGVSYVNLDPALVQVWVEAIVQRIS